jgi:beta-lactamase regulating signal transducer with metallopeptidase domain
MPPDVSSFHIFANGIAAYWGSITMDVIRSLLSEREIRAEKMVLNVPVGDREVRREFALIKNCLKIRGPVSLYSNARIISPATAGIIRQSVIIPERELILEEIRVTLCHELSHVKYHDTAFIMFSIAGSALYGEMCEPEFTDIVREAAERDCDRRAVAMMRRFEENAIKKYYTVIVDMIPEHPVDGWFLDLVSKSAFESMTDRIEYVTACERAGRAGAILGRAIAAGFLIAVTFFAYIIFVMIRRFDLWTCVMLLI